MLPLQADLNGDGRSEVIVASHTGKVQVAEYCRDCMQQLRLSCKHPTQPTPLQQRIRWRVLVHLPLNSMQLNGRASHCLLLTTCLSGMLAPQRALGAGNCSATGGACWPCLCTGASAQGGVAASSAEAGP